MSKKNGFTLIELLIVIIIIGILSALIFANFGDIRKKSRDSQRKSDLKQIQTALEFYRADNKVYPLTAAFPVCGSALTLGGSTYMVKVPCDPTNTGQYVYRYTSASGTTYTLTACLENTNDSQKDTTNNASICTGGTTNWSYTTQNP